MGKWMHDNDIVDVFRVVEFATVKHISEVCGRGRQHLGVRIRALVKQGVLAQDPVTGAYHLAKNEQGKRLRLGLVEAA